jgi:hypothetical protein
LLKSILVLTVVAVVSAAIKPASADEIAGRAENVRGTLTIDRNGRHVPLKTGDPVFIKDRIVTGASGSAEIVLVDQSRMKLAADTSLEISGYRFNTTEKIRHGVISLDFGKARFSVQDLQEFNDTRFRVITVTAITGSRDTDFIVAYDPELPREEVCRGGLTTTLCIDNSVVFSSVGFQDKPALLTAHMISQACGPNLPTPPRFATAAEFARILAGLDRTGVK